MFLHEKSILTTMAFSVVFLDPLSLLVQPETHGIKLARVVRRWWEED